MNLYMCDRCGSVYGTLPPVPPGAMQYDDPECQIIFARVPESGEENGGRYACGGSIRRLAIVANFFRASER